MDTEYIKMFGQPDQHSLIRRDRSVNVPRLNMSVAFNPHKGLMTPLSANSAAESRRNSASQSWNDAGLQQSISPTLPAHPNTPTHGLANVEMLNIDPCNNINISMSMSQRATFPMSTTYTQTSNDGFRLAAGEVFSGPPSSPVPGFPQPGQAMNHSTWHVPIQTPDTQLSCTSSSFAPSIGLSSFSGLHLDNASPSPFSQSYYQTTTDLPSLIGGSDSDSQSSLPSFTGPSQCIAPEHVLADPLQDPSRYMSYDWTKESSADNEYASQMAHLSSPHQLPSPMSTSTMDHSDFLLKDDPYLSDYSEANVSDHKTPPRVRSASRRVKREPKGRRALHKIQSCTANGTVVECSADDKAMNFKIAGMGSVAMTKDFPCSHPRCGKKFLRSEHQKRHMRIHDPTRDYLCYVPGCKAGGAKCGAVNRYDNAKDHAYTHLKAWLNSEGAPQLTRVWGIPPKKNKARNVPLDPIVLRQRILERVGDDMEECQKYFKTFNRKASNDFDIHFDWSHEHCVLKRCYYKRGQRCRICDVVRKKTAS